MGKSKVTKAGPSTPATRVTFKTVKSGGQYKDKIVKVPPQKKAWIARDDNQSPTKVIMEDPGMLPEEFYEPYPDVDDPPL